MIPGRHDLLICDLVGSFDGGYLFIDPLHHASRGSLELFKRNWLRQIIEGPAAHRLHGFGNAAKRCQQNHRGGRRALLHRAHHLEAVAIPHADVADHQIEAGQLEGPCRVANAVGCFNPPSVAQEVGPQRGAHSRFVVDY